MYVNVKLPSPLLTTSPSVKYPDSVSSQLVKVSSPHSSTISNQIGPDPPQPKKGRDDTV